MPQRVVRRRQGFSAGAVSATKGFPVVSLSYSIVCVVESDFVVAVCLTKVSVDDCIACLKAVRFRALSDLSDNTSSELSIR